LKIRDLRHQEPRVAPRRRFKASEIPIDLSSVSDLHDQNDQPVVFNLIDDPIVAHPNTV